MELGRSGRPMMTSASPGRGGCDGDGAGRAQRGTGSSNKDRKICRSVKGRGLERGVRMGARQPFRGDLPRGRDAVAEHRMPAGADCLRSAANDHSIPIISRKQGDFPRKTGRRLSTNGQSPRGIRDLDNFSKKITERKQGDDFLETGGVRCSRSCPGLDLVAVIRYAKIHGTKHRPWLAALLARRPTKVAAIALANKIARFRGQ